MVRRGNNSIKKLSYRNHRKIQKKSSIDRSSTKQTISENLDDETKLAKRHLTKEMWQLVSIAVKRMADEFATISNNQTRTSNQEPQTSILSTTEIVHLPIQQSSKTQHLGAGDELLTKDRSTLIKEPTPIQLLDTSSYTKKKATSNNASHRSIKSKLSHKSMKNNQKLTTKRLDKNYKMK
ncbi:hypothetical protein I4U23_006899 [Adineta vaga]|nr:hypothetical protein I4U23_006899 [Adineta vaga]